MLPPQDIYRHRHGSTGHGRDHVLPAFVAPTLTFPVLAGQVPLGTWQSIVLVDPNRDNPDRSVRFSFLAAGVTRSRRHGSHSQALHWGSLSKGCP